MLLDHNPPRLDSTTTMAVFRYDMDEGERFGMHAHPQHQLSWTPRGLLVADVARNQWELAPDHALWIPGGVLHDLGSMRSTLVYVVKFAAEADGPRWDEPTVVEVTPLIAALIEHLAASSVSGATRHRAEAVLCDQLVPSHGNPPSIPLPVDDRALAVARVLLANPADARGLGEWSRTVGTSERTLVRLFAEQTGLSFSAWRTHVRIRAALRHLDNGEQIGSTARRVGYRDVGSFISAFRRTIGTTPGAYANRGSRASPAGDGPSS